MRARNQPDRKVLSFVQMGGATFAPCTRQGALPPQRPVVPKVESDPRKDGLPMLRTGHTASAALSVRPLVCTTSCSKRSLTARARPIFLRSATTGAAGAALYALTRGSAVDWTALFVVATACTLVEKGAYCAPSCERRWLRTIGKVSYGASPNDTIRRSGRHHFSGWPRDGKCYRGHEECDTT
jgi:hypothetical protein